MTENCGPNWVHFGTIMGQIVRYGSHLGSLRQPSMRYFSCSCMDYYPWKGLVCALCSFVQLITILGHSYSVSSVANLCTIVDTLINGLLSRCEYPTTMMIVPLRFSFHAPLSTHLSASAFRLCSFGEVAPLLLTCMCWYHAHFFGWLCFGCAVSQHCTFRTSVGVVWRIIVLNKPGWTQVRLPRESVAHLYGDNMA